jgi:hypothetical protein
MPTNCMVGLSLSGQKYFGFVFAIASFLQLRFLQSQLRFYNLNFIFAISTSFLQLQLQLRRCNFNFADAISSADSALAVWHSLTQYLLHLFLEVEIN